MSNTFVDPENDLKPEFIPTDVRFYVSAQTKELRGLISRMAAIATADALTPGTDLIRMEIVPSSSVNPSFLRMSATNGSVFMKSSLRGVVAQGSNDLYVPSKKLSDVLKLAQGDTVTLSCVGFELQVSSGNSLWRIKLPSNVTIPSLSGNDGSMFSIGRSELQRILSGVIRAAASGLSRVSLTQIRLGDGYAISCDGPRMHRIQSESLEGVRSFTIPTLGAKLFFALLKAHEDENSVKVSNTDLAVSLITETEEVTVLRSKVPFPDVEKVFISQSILNDSAAVVSRADLVEAIDQVKIFADSVLSGVSLTSQVLPGDRTVLSVYSKDEVGNFSSTDIPATLTGKNVVDLRLNYKQLQDALTSVWSEFVTIRVAKNSKSSLTSAFIEDVETGFVAVLGQTVKDM